MRFHEALGERLRTVIWLEIVEYGGLSLKRQPPSELQLS